MTEKAEDDLSTLIPDDHNANDGTERGGGFLESSLRKFGAGRSIFVDKNNRIIAGNKTHAQALELGMKAHVVESDGNTLIVVKRNDVDLDTKEGREMALADNRVGEVNLSWSKDELALMRDSGVEVENWFFGNELTKIFSDGEPNNPTVEWTGMPEFEQKDKTAFKSVIVHMKDQEAVDAFAKLLGLKEITNRYLWYPKIEIEQASNKVFFSVEPPQEAAKA